MLGRVIARTLMLGSVAVGLWSASAAASTPVHLKRALGPIAFDAPAGAVCDFAVHLEQSGTLNLTRFFDEQGNLVRVEAQADMSYLTRNVDTGRTLAEEVHFARHADLVSGEVRDTGQSWHDRDEDGRLVLTGAGLIAFDFTTGDVFRETPDAKSDSAATICPALGGSPA